MTHDYNHAKIQYLIMCDILVHKENNGFKLIHMGQAII